MQCLGASGACHMGAVFVSRHYAPFRDDERGQIYIPEQTWGASSLPKITCDEQSLLT